MGAAALWRRSWAEAGAWALSVALFGLAMLLHTRAVSAVVLPGDPASPGWVAPGGWRYVLAALRASTVLGYLPGPIAAIAVPLALLGWLSRRDATSTLAALYLAGFAVMLTLLGRPDNFYWATMIGRCSLPAWPSRLPRCAIFSGRSSRRVAQP